MTDFNADVTTAAGLITELAALGTTWTAIASTPTVDARDNSDTNPSSTGIPIYTTSGLRIADDNADLWDGSIQNPIMLDDGTSGGNLTGGQRSYSDYTWTGSNTNGTGASSGDGRQLSTDGNLRVSRGGRIDSGWISGVSINSADTRGARLYGISDVLGGTTPAADPEITEIDYDPDAGNLRIRWDSQDGRLYNLRSESDPSVAAPIDWPIFDGHQDLAATPPENTLTFPLPADSERFFVIEGFPAPPVSVLSEDFESGQGDWVPGNSGVPLPDPPGGVSSPTATVWELGTPDPVLLGGPPAAHSGTNCFGTDLDTSYADLTGVFLRSPSINLTTAAGATLTFWRFYDIETGFDWGRVRVLDAADDSEIAVLEETFDGTTNDWEEVSIKLPAEVAGKMVKIEFILATDDVTNNPQAGLYIDDVSVTVP
ncbi:MAG: hypothetical protein GY872_03385 [Roseibacillus sp.]|nr:hypothetical protein [Roseibacillus sp.]